MRYIITLFIFIMLAIYTLANPSTTEFYEKSSGINPHPPVLFVDAVDVDSDYNEPIQELSFDDNLMLMKKDGTHMLDFGSYSISYNETLRLPIVVQFRLKGFEQKVKGIKKRPSWKSEYNLPKESRLTNRDYKHSGFDKGHIYSDASADFDKYNLKKAYTLANTIPQYPKSNRYTWSQVEREERKIAIRHSNILVTNVIRVDNGFETKGRLNIPTGIYKVLDYTENIRDGKHIVKCYYYKNEKNPKKEKLKDHEVQCSEVTTGSYFK